MQAIAKDVYIESQYPGVVLGAIVLSDGLIQIDAPPSPEDGRSWRASLLSLSSGPERMLINLDAHPDRTLGVRSMDCTVVAHEKAAAVFRSRPTTFKIQSEETGAEWEEIQGVGNIRWAPPEITFTHQMSFHWGNTPVIVEHHPGPAQGACWVLVPEVRVVFVGDAVIAGQPPFLANANIPEWLETLKLLTSPAYRGWQVISGRSGLVNLDQIRAQGEFLKKALAKMEKLVGSKNLSEAFDTLANALAGDFKVSANRQQKYLQRLRYGLRHYYNHHFHPSASSNHEE